MDPAPGIPFLRKKKVIPIARKMTTTPTIIKPIFMLLFSAFFAESLASEDPVVSSA